MNTLLNEVSTQDELAAAFRFRSMVHFIEKTYPKTCEHILKKIIDVTPYEIKTMTYNKSQYKRLEKYCEEQGFKGNRTVN